MPDLATITAFFGSIKTATDIANAIRGADLSLEKAELKLKIAELMECLADVRIRATEIQEVIQEKDNEIKNLKKLLGEKENPQVEKLSGECVKILNLLNEVPEDADGLISSQIAYHVQIPESNTKYFLDLLEEKDFVGYVIDMDIGTQYYINKKGRKYLFENA